MKNASNEHYKKFYEKLAHLFYAVAAADDIIRQEEKEVLHQMVLEDWLDLENSKDAFGTDSAFSIEVVFDQLEELDLKSDRAFEMFEKYYHNHPEMFDEDVVKRIFHTTHRIASAFHQKNKSEHNLLTRIHILLGHASV
jgi:hypothetical protein